MKNPSPLFCQSGVCSSILAQEAKQKTFRFPGFPSYMKPS
jgi:cellobiose-specific phosphotransferase system component IIB